ncbi:transposase [Nonomuraea insulae]|uniref:Transposase n=1 Tax=Nonomuraea insulae TaxID=1616787 RepID=A0ABW1CNQ0_9ACTN
MPTTTKTSRSWRELLFRGGGEEVPARAGQADRSDSQSLRAAETVAAGSRGYDAAKKVQGTKRHIIVDTLGLLLVVIVTAASVQDRDGAKRALALLRDWYERITLIWADSAYAGKLVTWAQKHVQLTLEIVKRSDDVSGFVILPRRWVVERTLSWICQRRRCVRDYERLSDHHEAMEVGAEAARPTSRETMLCRRVQASNHEASRSAEEMTTLRARPCNRLSPSPRSARRSPRRAPESSRPIPTGGRGAVRLLRGLHLDGDGDVVLAGRVEQRVQDEGQAFGMCAADPPPPGLRGRRSPGSA